MTAEYEKPSGRSASSAVVSTASQRKMEQARSLVEQRLYPQAQALCDAVLKANPVQGEALFLSGLIAAATGKPKKAEALFHKATRADPRNANALHRLGLVQQAQGSLDAALGSFGRAIAVDPRLAVAFVDRGNVLRLLNRVEEAVASYDAAIAIGAGHEPLNNRGVVLTHLGQFEAALASFDRAIELRPDYAQAHYNRALTLLLHGDLGRGFAGFEWRSKLMEGPSGEAQQWFAQRLWLGNPSLHGKSIVLYSEQGLGDTIQFCRYVPAVANLGAKVILEVQEPLQGLLSQLPGVARVVTKQTPLGRFDYQCPLMSLPLAFKTTLDSIPCFPSYLRCEAAKLAQWRSRLGPKTAPRIGLVWSGSRTHANDRNRSIPFAELARCLPPGFQYVGLQKDIRADDRRAMRDLGGFVDLSQSLEDFSDTAAVCECMDLVISVDTSVAHLSAALGRPTWIMLPVASDWRWLLDREDSPWYPTARLHRQRRPGDWTAVLARIRRDLLGEFGDGRHG